MIFCILFAGCATTITGRYQEVKINSNVSGALIELDGVEIGHTPFTGKVKRGSLGKIKVSKPGYVAGSIQLQKKKDLSMNTSVAAPFVTGGAVYGVKATGDWFGEPAKGSTEIFQMSVSTTALVGGVAFGATTGAIAGAGPSALGSSTDDLSGASWEYSPSQYYVELKAEGRSGLDFSNDVAIRYFATVNHSQIAIDAGKNDGEYVNALANLMKSRTNEEVAKQSINEALEKSKGDQVLFGDAIIERFRQ